MPYKNPADRKYKQAAKYEDSPEQVKNREARNKARSELAKKGKVTKGDGKDVDHIKPLSKGGANTEGNLRIKSASANRSFSRNSDHTIKKNKPKNGAN